MSELAERLRDCFWEAAERTKNDDSIHGMSQPYFNQEMQMIDTSGCGMPEEFWEHFADVWTTDGKW